MARAPSRSGASMTHATPSSSVHVAISLGSRLLTEIRDGGLSSRALAWLFEATDAPIEQGAGYTGRWTHAPVDKYGAPIVPGDWPVNPRGRVA